MYRSTYRTLGMIHIHNSLKIYIYYLIIFHWLTSHLSQTPNLAHLFASFFLVSHVESAPVQFFGASTNR
uniref:Uncharacterized protein n=1 Tax=Rhizophora mucronata TaxID=61149 RepID=A0A2P2JGB9_RHIMU